MPFPSESKEYRALLDAQEAFTRLDTLEALHALEAAERAHNAALTKAQQAWAAIPAGSRKGSAEDNANDCVGYDRIFSEQDTLAFLRCCVGSFDFVE